MRKRACTAGPGRHSARPSTPAIPGSAGLPTSFAALSIIRLLDETKTMGLLGRARDEGRYWENRDAKALAETVGEWNSQLAALVGQIKDGLRGHIIAAPIIDFPNYEHLEADVRKSDHGDPESEEAEPTCVQRPTAAPSAASGGTTGLSGRGRAAPLPDVRACPRPGSCSG